MALPLIPIITSVLPLLIKGAELAFSGKEGTPGSAKKAMVMAAIEKFYDSVNLGKVLPDWERIDEKKLFLDLCGVLVDHLVPQVLEAK